MTTCVALVYPKFKLAVIGADGQVTVGESISKLTAKKFHVHDKMGFAFAGSALGGMAASRLFREIVDAEENPENVIMEFQKRVERFDKPVLYKNFTVGLVAWPEGLYTVCTQDIASKQEHAVHGALIGSIGSGSPYAVGALTAMAMNTDFDAIPQETLATRMTEMVTQAINIAIEHDRNSGGTPRTEVLRG